MKKTREEVKTEGPHEDESLSNTQSWDSSTEDSQRVRIRLRVSRRSLNSLNGRFARMVKHLRPPSTKVTRLEST